MTIPSNILCTIYALNIIKDKVRKSNNPNVLYGIDRKHFFKNKENLPEQRKYIYFFNFRIYIKNNIQF